MKDRAIGALRELYHRLPAERRPAVKTAVFGALLRARSLVSGRPIQSARRIEFLDFEIAHLLPHEFLSPGPGEILVESVCSTVSPGTERAVLCGLPGARRNFPYTPGYSCAGRVVRAGRRVTGFRPGDRVAGRIHHLSRETVGPDLLFHIPDGVSFEDASFIELAIITQQGIRKARIRPGETVAVLGQGILGQLSNRYARLLGAARVVAVASSRSREATASRPGGAHEYVATRESPDRVKALQADVVIEAVGTPQAVEIAMSAARPGGRVCLLGSSRGLGRNVDLAHLAQDRNLDLIGAHISALPDRDPSPGRWSYRAEGTLFLDLLAAGRLSVADLVTWRARPEEANAVYEVLARGGDDQVGIVFHWTGEEAGAA